MHAVPEKLAAMRESFEAALQRQMIECRVEFEKKLKDACLVAEDNAVRRAEEQLAPRHQLVAEELKDHLRSTRAANEEAVERVGQVVSQHAGLHAEVQPLHARADAAAARLDRLAVQTATASKDLANLGEETRGAIVELRAGLAEEGFHRRELEATIRGLIMDSANAAAATAKEIGGKIEAQQKLAAQNAAKLEERLMHRIDDSEQRNLREFQLGDQDTLALLRPEIAEAATVAERKAEELFSRAERAISATASVLREEVEAARQRTKGECDRVLDKRASELDKKIDESSEAAATGIAKTKQTCDKSLEDSTIALRKGIAECRTGLEADVERVRQEMSNSETRFNLFVSEAESRAVKTAAQRVEPMVSDLSKKVNEHREAEFKAIDDLRVEYQKHLKQTIEKLERSIKDAESHSINTSAVALSQANAQMRADLTDSIRGANEKTDQVRCTLMEQLRSEVEARQTASLAADGVREAQSGSLRESLRQIDKDAKETLQHLKSTVDRKLDLTNAAIHSLEKSVDALQKDHVEMTASVKSQLQVERQQVEERNLDALKHVNQARDSLEASMRADVTDIRENLAQCRKKVSDDATLLRNELREYATKKEIAEAVSLSKERCDEAMSITNSARGRLEDVVQDFAGRYREIQNEAQDFKLRGQREITALGHEVTQLKAASSSLASGVVKGLFTLGLIKDDAENVSGTSVSTAGLGTTVEPLNRHRAVEIDDLLQWEKVGKSLSTRITRMWYQREAAGYPTLLALVDSKALSEEVALGGTGGSAFSLGQSTCATMSEAAPSTGATLPKPPPGPSHVKGESPKDAQVRQQLAAVAQ